MERPSPVTPALIPGTPLVIWTLQRTGGTNLTRHLVELIGLPTTEHEPFNVGRVHGGVTEAWQRDADDGALAAAMATIASRPTVIKHCVEMVPAAVSHALARATSAQGFRHLFLHRREALGRLLSLQFARVSGIWGANMRKGRRADAELIQVQALPVPQLLAHERHSVTALSDCWRQLLSLGQAPVALAFEDVYAVPPAEAQAHLLQVMADLGLSLPVGDRSAWLAQVLDQGGQGTRDLYQHFGGVEQLAAGLSGVAPFKPELPAVRCSVLQPAEPPSWGKWVSLDALPEAVPSRTNLEGLVVLAPAAPKGLRLLLRSGGSECAVPWGFRSDWAARTFPGSPNGAKARFSLRALLSHGVSELLLQDPRDGSEQVCLSLQVTPQPSAA